MRGFDGKRIVVAGAGAGIGAATAMRLAAEGARVIVGDIDERGARQTAVLITEAGGTADAVRFDLADEASTDALFSAPALTATAGSMGLPMSLPISLLRPSRKIATCCK